MNYIIPFLILITIVVFIPFFLKINRILVYLTKTTVPFLTIVLSPETLTAFT